MLPPARGGLGLPGTMEHLRCAMLHSAERELCARNCLKPAFAAWVRRASPVTSMTSGRPGKGGIGSSQLTRRRRFLSFMVVIPKDLLMRYVSREFLIAKDAFPHEFVTATSFVDPRSNGTPARPTRRAFRDGIGLESTSSPDITTPSLCGEFPHSANHQNAPDRIHRWGPSGGLASPRSFCASIAASMSL